MADLRVRRHGAGAIWIHWFNALCWLFLLATGLGLIRNPDLQPLGAWWPDLTRALFRGGGNLLKAHVSVGILWASVWLITLVLGATRLTLPFLGQILRYRFALDFQWLIKKNLQMTLGRRMMARLVRPLGWDDSIPDQEFYNAGQKLAALGMVAGALVLCASGLILVAGRYAIEPHQVIWVQWSISLHYIAAGMTFGILLVHIYMAAVSREERPAFFSMFTGYVPVAYARHHHRLWLEALEGLPGKQTHNG